MILQGFPQEYSKKLRNETLKGLTFNKSNLQRNLGIVYCLLNLIKFSKIVIDMPLRAKDRESRYCRKN